MPQKIYQIDAFAHAVFSGNPAAVCPLETWLGEETMINIAAENNLAETAFYVKNGDQYDIRWFTPAVEVDLCGHATLAAAYVLFHHEGHEGNSISFHSHRSGPLTVTKNDDLLTLDFPADEFNEVPIDEQLSSCFDKTPLDAFKGKTDYMLVFDNETQIREIRPNLPQIEKLQARGVIITAKGDEVDFVSRFFAPQSGVNEDPVTGSAHTTLIPYWADKLGKNDMKTIQLSQRTGHLQVRSLGKRVEISGYGKLYLKGYIYL